MLAECLVEQSSLGGEFAARNVDGDALVAEDSKATARGLLGRIVRADDDASDPGLDDRTGARRGLALVAAGLQRYVERRAREVGVTQIGGASCRERECQSV